MFTERQKFRQVWLWLLLAIVLVIVIVNARIPRTIDTAVNITWFRIVSIAIPAILTVLFYVFRLDTKIDETGIYYKFYPFHILENKLDWDLIDKIYVRKYQPIWEYGGWGIRGLGKNRALNVSGNMGIQIELKNGKRLLLGTQKPDEAAAVLEQLTISGKIPGNQNITREHF